MLHKSFFVALKKVAMQALNTREKLRIFISNKISSDLSCCSNFLCKACEFFRTS
jgi:hypothetical protein